MIKPSQPSNLEEIKALTESCAIAMQEKGIYQWNEHYPSLEKLEEDIEKAELFILEENEKILGIIVLTDLMDEEYVPIKWLTESGNNLYVHRLATHPSVWGKGFGSQLMDFAENYARENKFDSVRLDTFSQNKKNHQFYESRGYQKLGDIFFPKQSEDPFHCYELVLKNNE